MTPQDADWTGQWLARTIGEEPIVSSVELLSTTVLRIERTEYEAVIVATATLANVDADSLSSILDFEPEPDFVVNLAREADIAPDAFMLSSERGIPVGGVGDLRRALKLRDLSEYRDQEFGFVERCLSQHSRVERFDRLDHRRYLIYRLGMTAVRVVFLNDYDVTVDSLRNARARFGDFSVVALTNPNARVTDAAREVSESLECRVLTWREFLSALHRER